MPAEKSMPRACGPPGLLRTGSRWRSCAGVCLPSVIDKLHRKIVDAGYPAPPWDQLDAAALDDAVRARLAAEWEARARSEARSMIVFASLVPRFTEIGMPLEVTSATS